MHALKCTVLSSFVSVSAISILTNGQVPLTMRHFVELCAEAGIPSGVINIVNGAVETVQALISHPKVASVTFVGTSKVAELVQHAARKLNKRAVCLGGAKNYLVAAPDCNVALTAADVVASFTGCAGIHSCLC